MLSLGLAVLPPPINIDVAPVAIKPHDNDNVLDQHNNNNSNSNGDNDSNNKDDNDSGDNGDNDSDDTILDMHPHHVLTRMLCPT
jgi:hypothetical protein